MPYKSEAQRKFFNSPAGKAKLGKEKVEKWIKNGAKPTDTVKDLIEKAQNK